MRAWRPVLKVAVTVSLLSWFFYRLDLRDTLRALAGAHVLGLLAVFLLSVAMIFTLALRWQLLLRSLNGPSLRFREIGAATFISHFFGYFLPAVGGDVVKVSYLVRRGSPPVELAVSTLVDRCVGLLALLGLGLFALLIRDPVGHLHRLVSVVYLSATALLALALWLGLMTRTATRRMDPLLGGPLRRPILVSQSIGRALDLYARQKVVLLQALGISIASQLLSILVYYGLALAVGARGRFLDFLYGVPVVNLAIVLPVSIGGIGVGEWTFIRVFTDLGMSEEAAFSVSLFNLLVRLGAGLVGAALLLERRRHVRQ